MPYPIFGKVAKPYRTKPGSTPKPHLQRGPAIVRLEATDAGGQVLSNNTYWQAKDDAGYRAMNDMAPVSLNTSVATRVEGDETIAALTLTNQTPTPAIEAKLTVMNQNGEQVLPAFFTDNYVSLLPGETRTIEVRYPTAKAERAGITLRGWNVAKARVELGQ